MEVGGLSLVDLWQTYVLLIHHQSTLIAVHIHSRIGEDRSLVRHRSAFYVLMAL